MIRAARKDWREDVRFDSWEVVIFEERVEYEDAVAVCLVRPDIPAPFLIMDCCSMEMHRAWCYEYRGSLVLYVEQSRAVPDDVTR